MKIIGVTGSFGTGKTFVSSIFKSLGAKVLDADKIAHETIGKGRPAYRQIVGAFGEGILDARGNIVRSRLAAKVFGHKGSLKKINKIVHPYVIKFIKEKIRKARRDDIIVIDAPLLVEANVAGLVDMLVVVKSTRANQIERCRKKFSINKEEVLKRIEGQISLKTKMKLADFVIDNNGTRSETKKQVVDIWREVSRKIA